LGEHLVANVPASGSRYRMLFEIPPDILRLFRAGDFVHPSRQPRRPGKYSPKITPERDQIPAEYGQLLDWYEIWSKEIRETAAPINWEDDPLIRLIGSGRHIWANEHADEYVENLRREDPA